MIGRQAGSAAFRGGAKRSIRLRAHLADLGVGPPARPAVMSQDRGKDLSLITRALRDRLILAERRRRARYRIQWLPKVPIVRRLHRVEANSQDTVALLELLDNVIITAGFDGAEKSRVA